MTASTSNDAVGVGPGYCPLVARVIARLNVGGPAIQAILMTDALRQRGYRTLLLAGYVPPGESSMEYLAEEFGVQPVRVSRMSRPLSLGRDLRALYELVKIFRREKPAIVHTHTAKAGVVGRIAAMLTGVPIRVHTFHGHVFDGYFSPPATRLFVAIERWLARHTERLLVVSPSQRDELVERFRIAPAEKIQCIPLGINLDPFLSAGREGSDFRRRIGCPAESLGVAWVGRLTSIKAPGVLVEAAAQMPATTRPHFVVIGDGELRADTVAAVNQAGLDACFSFAGIVRSMPDAYAALDLVVLTSRNEGTPVTLLESMACGKPFIATDVGGVRDLMVGPRRMMGRMEVFDNGILTPVDPAAIAEAIEYLRTRPQLRAEMGLRGREFVASRYTYQRLADDLDRLYRELVERKFNARNAGQHAFATFGT